MACLIKAPDAAGKGCISFTTPERDHLIKLSEELRQKIKALKKRYVIGLHHNWHDHHFVYDDLFDFSMAGDGDLISETGQEFLRAPIDACNFAPEYFNAGQGAHKFWDVLNVSRAVSFKGIPEFFDAVREIYDVKKMIRVLHICPVPPAEDDGSTLHDIRERYEALFSPDERNYFTLITMEWDYPFPLDLESLAFFYRSSRVYVHSAPQERRCRIAAYAWASGLPVVSRENVATIVPPALRRKPFWFEFDRPADLPSAMLDAIDHCREGRIDDPHWRDISAEFRAQQSADRLSQFLGGHFEMSHQSINASRLDIRLGRHHEISDGPNRVPQALAKFCEEMERMTDANIAKIAAEPDPEIAICGPQKEIGARLAKLSRRMERLGRQSKGALKTFVKRSLGIPSK